MDCRLNRTFIVVIVTVNVVGIGFAALARVVQTERFIYGVSIFATKAERMARRIKENSDVLLWLMRGESRSERDRLSDGRVEVTNLKVEMHHRTLVPREWRPHRRHVVGCFLKHDVNLTLGRRENGRSRFLMGDWPTEQQGVKAGENAGIRRFNGSAPPHTR
jgi:hypothetical protein